MKKFKKVKMEEKNLRSDFEIIGKLGNGSFGDVHLVMNKNSKKKYAAKISQSKNGKRNNLFLREKNAYLKIQNPVVLKLISYSLENFQGKPNPVLILEYMPNGSLEDHLHKRTALSQPKESLTKSNKYIILLGIALGMKFLHSIGIIHRDLKPSNILLDEHFYPKICDFGSSFLSSNLKISQIKMKSKGMKTPLYMAPEICDDEPYTPKVDVYSFALIMYRLLTGNEIFNEYKTFYSLHEAVKKGERPDLSMISDEDIQSFISRCWHNDPRQRPSFDEVVEEVMQNRYKEYFEANEDEVFAYLNLFEDEIKDPKFDGYYRIRYLAEKGDSQAMFYYGLLLKDGFECPMN